MEHNAAALVDRLAEIRAQIRELESEESDIRAAIIKLEQNIVEGKQYTAILKLVPSTRLDTKAVKEEMGADWYKAHSITSQSLRIETVARMAA